MKKYFYKGTNKEIKFGDKVDVHTTKGNDGYIQKIDLHTTFDALVAEVLSDLDIIEVKEVQEPKKPQPKPEAPKDEITALKAEIAELKNKFKQLEDYVFHNI